MSRDDWTMGASRPRVGLAATAVGGVAGIFFLIGGGGPEARLRSGR